MEVTLPRPKLNQQVPDMAGAIKETAWQQIAENGPPGLSLRAIARQLEITAPAIYNYFPSRDDLVTALVIDAYASFAEALLAGDDSVPENEFEGRIKATGEAYYRWAINFPHQGVHCQVEYAGDSHPAAFPDDRSAYLEPGARAGIARTLW